MMEQVKNVTADEISDVMLALCERYGELFPDWDVFVMSIEKTGDKNEQLDKIIRMLENLKDK